MRWNIFVSYYDYYQPEAYIANSAILYIEKDSSHQRGDRPDCATAPLSALLERRDVIVVASVSCIYGIGDPGRLQKTPQFPCARAWQLDRDELMRQAGGHPISRETTSTLPGARSACGAILWKSFPLGMADKAIRVEFFGDEIDRILEVDALTGKPLSRSDYAMIFPATHYAVGRGKC